jgi:hypothetical protein
LVAHYAIGDAELVVALFTKLRCGIGSGKGGSDPLHLSGGRSQRSGGGVGR